MKIDEDMAEIIGIHIGDGCISINDRYKEYYLGGDLTEEKEYHDKWVSRLFNKKVMLPLYNKKIRYKEYKKTGVYAFYIFDSKIVNFFIKLGIHSGTKINMGVPTEIRNNKKLAKRFLRGLFDTDGSIYFDKSRVVKKGINNIPQIKLGTVSENLINDIFEMLIGLGFHPRKKKPYKGKKDKNAVHTLLIYRRSDIRKYINEIGFKNPKHYTKWFVYEKYGFCLPYTSLKERKDLLSKVL